VARKIKNVNKGVTVKITPMNSRKIKRITEDTHRTFASEVNFGVEFYADQKIHQYKDDGK
jgi:hypothetical protein